VPEAVLRVLLRWHLLRRLRVPGLRQRPTAQGPRLCRAEQDPPEKPPCFHPKGRAPHSHLPPLQYHTAPVGRVGPDWHCRPEPAVQPSSCWVWDMSRAALHVLCRWRSTAKRSSTRRGADAGSRDASRSTVSASTGRSSAPSTAGRCHVALLDPVLHLLEHLLEPENSVQFRFEFLKNDREALCDQEHVAFWSKRKYKPRIMLCCSLFLSFSPCQVLPNAAKCCHMLPHAATCCQMLPNAARC
jgi:hypothetical protein